MPALRASSARPRASRACAGASEAQARRARSETENERNGIGRFKVKVAKNSPRPARLRALRIAAIEAGGAPFLIAERALTAARARAEHGAAVADGRAALLRGTRLGGRQKADRAHVLFDHLADSGEQRGHVAPLHPLAA